MWTLFFLQLIDPIAVEINSIWHFLSVSFVRLHFRTKNFWAKLGSESYDVNFHASKGDVSLNCWNICVFKVDTLESILEENTRLLTGKRNLMWKTDVDWFVPRQSICQKMKIIIWKSEERMRNGMIFLERWNTTFHVSPMLSSLYNLSLALLLLI